MACAINNYKSIKMECPLTTWNWEEHFVRGESIDLKLSVQRIFGTMVCLKSLCYASITLLSTALLSDALPQAIPPSAGVCS